MQVRKPQVQQEREKQSSKQARSAKQKQRGSKNFRANNCITKTRLDHNNKNN
jgi:hypothetical protein